MSHFQTRLTQAIQRLVRQAYPEAPPSVWEVLAKDHFVDAIIAACVADETKPRYSPSANQRPKACSDPPHVTRLFCNSL